MTPRKTNLDVAKLAKVSVATVSYVLNNNGSVGEKTRRRVLSVMQELGYQPNPHATRLRRSASANHTATGNVGLAWTNTVMHPHAHAENMLNQGVSRSLERQGFHALVTFGDEDRIFSPNYLGKIDALILAGTPHPEFIKDLVRRMPVVSTNTLVEDLPVPTVTVDDRHVGRVVANHLISLGHKRIAFVSHTATNPFFNLRKQGYSEVMQAAGLWDERLVISGNPAGAISDEEIIGVEKLMRAWLKLPAEDRPTAIFAANDELARVVYQFSDRHHIRIPQDWSVAGCDNDPGICLSLDPQLTTVELPFSQMGERAAEMVLQKLKNGEDDLGSATFLRGKLIEKGSCQRLA